MPGRFFASLFRGRYYVFRLNDIDIGQKNKKCDSYSYMPLRFYVLAFSLYYCLYYFFDHLRFAQGIIVQYGHAKRFQFF